MYINYETKIKYFCIEINFNCAKFHTPQSAPFLVNENTIFLRVLYRFVKSSADEEINLSIAIK